ncbi:MAG: membrane protein insertase YidC [Pseudomonadota bacterium]|nr:membrane protein insertase YidC [Pseudomonadota bacterium]
MELWTYWLSAIQGLLTILSSQVGLGTGLGIIALTVLLRTVMLPISWRVAYRGSIRQKKMLRLQPELQRLKVECGDEPRAYAQRMMKLYQERGVTVMDWRSILGSLVQMPLFLGMYQTLRAGANGARFLWVETLSRPDPWFALLAGFTMMLVMAANPDLPEHMRLVLIVVPSILAAVAALKFCSALAVYWAVSNGYSAIQTSVLHYVVARRIKSGVVSI